MLLGPHVAAVRRFGTVDRLNTERPRPERARTHTEIERGGERQTLPGIVHFTHASWSQTHTSSDALVFTGLSVWGIPGAALSWLQRVYGTGDIMLDWVFFLIDGEMDGV